MANTTEISAWFLLFISRVRFSRGFIVCVCVCVCVRVRVCKEILYTCV